MDVKTVFLNRYLNEEVYMEQPEGFVNLKYPNRVCKLKRSIYGLKKASRRWNKRFDDEIKKFGFTQNRDEPCVNLKASREAILLLLMLPRKSYRITKGARHFRAKVHYLRKVIEYGDIKLEKVHTDDHLDDSFTKALAFPKHFEHTRNIRMHPASSLM
nr:reverse transcriptase [Tanacetum cinerariifolium]